MAVYTLMYDKTVTLFNRYQSTLGDLWYPTVLHGVDLIVDRASIVAKYGEESSGEAKLHIRYSVVKGADNIQGKIYLPPKEWDRQPNDSLSDYITFTGGEDFDFIWEGEMPGGPIQDEDYKNGFYDYMNTRYNHVYAVVSVAKYGVIPHFEIIAK